jgi:hypothetical protein
LIIEALNSLPDQQKKVLDQPIRNLIQKNIELESGGKEMAKVTEEGKKILAN